ncbi:MAG: sugar phosphate isomerase/epimerase family protein [Opitutaceae bacterium]|jgi:sugar phosphate isomerase/epimerase
MIRIDCISTLGCPELDLDGAIALARRFGLWQLELRALANRLDLPAYLTEQFGSPAALAAHVSSAGMTVPVLDTNMSLASPDAHARGDFLAFIPWAKALGTRYLRVFDDGVFAPVASDDAIAAMVATVRWWQDLRARHGWTVDIIVETHDLICARANVLRLEESLDTPVPILWDTWHTWFKGGEKIEETWKALRPYIKHVHFKDGVREPILHYPYTYRIPGTGVFPLGHLAAMLAKDGYAGSVCLEWERMWHPYLPPLEEALAACTKSGA